jgi:hypothetical protein
MMGVCMEEESTVTMVSQEIKRPNGAYAALNFLCRGVPAVLSANKLMGDSVSDGWDGGDIREVVLGGADAANEGDKIGDVADNGIGDTGDDDAGSDLAAGG